MNKLLSLKIPGPSGGVTAEDVPAPSGIPTGLRGGFDTSGVAFIQTALNFLFLIASFFALIVFIWAGIQWITSKGDSYKIGKAKSRIRYAIIGLILCALSFLIVNAVAGLFGAPLGKLLNPSQMLQ